MMYFFYLDGDGENVCRIVVWNRKTGEPVRFQDLSGHSLLNLPQVLDLSSADESELVKAGTQAIFLDEFCLAVIPDRSAIAELAVFNTLILQDHPGYLQRLAFPPEFHNKSAKIHADHDRDLGTPNRDEALLPDPAQVVLVINLRQHQESGILLVVRTQVLVKQVHSVRADRRVPWDQWGRDTVAIQAQNGGDGSSIFVHGVRVMIVWPLVHRLLGNWHVHSFDFSQHGRGSLPLRGGADGIRRWALFEDGVDIRLEPGLVVGPFDGLQSLSDGTLICLVSCLIDHVGSGVVG